MCGESWHVSFLLYSGVSLQAPPVQGLFFVLPVAPSVPGMEPADVILAQGPQLRDGCSALEQPRSKGCQL